MNYFVLALGPDGYEYLHDEWSPELIWFFDTYEEAIEAAEQDSYIKDYCLDIKVFDVRKPCHE